MRFSGRHEDRASLVVRGYAFANPTPAASIGNLGLLATVRREHAPEADSHREGLQLRWVAAVLGADGFAVAEAAGRSPAGRPSEATALTDEIERSSAAQPSETNVVVGMQSRSD
jgi:hypothetical protein